MINYSRFLAIGQRYDLDLGSLIDFSELDWVSHLRERVYKEGKPYPPMGSDYFVFVKDTLGEIPPFAVGRPFWDNWMIFNARDSGMPVIDITRTNLVVHQTHDYSHVRNSFNEGSYFGPESQRHLELTGGTRKFFVLHDATHILTKKGIFPAIGLSYLKRRVRTLAVIHPKLRPFADWIKQFERS